jgi:hypothetical protein
MKELLKLGTAIHAWPWPKMGFLLAVGLLLKGAVTFEQALIVAMFAYFIDHVKPRQSIPRSSKIPNGLPNKKSSGRYRGRTKAAAHVRRRKPPEE